MKKHYNVKVNTIFNGEFVSGDKRANKSINTKNYELFRTSDLREWYERCVIEPSLASLEVSGTRQRVGTVANTKFDCKYK